MEMMARARSLTVFPVPCLAVLPRKRGRARSNWGVRVFAHIGWLVALAIVGLIRSVTKDKHAWWRLILIVIVVAAVTVQEFFGASSFRPW